MPPLVRLLSALGPLLLGAVLLIASPARADEPSCANPQDAARSLLDWLQPDNWDPVAASKCLGLSPEQGPETAIKLKEVLDARGMYVPVTEMSLDPDYKNEDGLHRAVPLPTYPELAMVKRDGQWVWSEDLVRKTDRLYDETFSGLSGWLQKQIPAQFNARLVGLQTWQWAYLGLLLLLSLSAGLIAQKVLADQFVRLSSRFGIALDARVVNGTRWPLTWFAIGAVFAWGIPDIRLGVHASRSLLFGATTIVSMAAVLILVRVIDVGADFFAKRAAATESKLDDQVIPLVTRAAKVGVWILGIVFVVQNMGVDVASLLAGLGIGGLAFALAAKDTVENLFGSITIFTDRPFQIGDWVVIGGDVEGVVEEVGFRSTRIRTFYNSVVSVPNGKVAVSTIDNMGQRRYRRVKTTLGLTYGTPPDKVQRFVEEVRAFVKTNPAVWKGTCEIHFAAFSASSLDIMVYFFLDVANWTEELDERAKCYLEFMRIAERVGVSFAYPSTSVYLEKVPEEMQGMLTGGAAARSA